MFNLNDTCVRIRIFLFPLFIFIFLFFLHVFLRDETRAEESAFFIRIHQFRLPVRASIIFFLNNHFGILRPEKSA